MQKNKKNGGQSPTSLPTPVVPLDIPDQPLFSLHIRDELATADELFIAAKKPKNGKTPGRDHISAEMIKFSLRRTLAIWLSFFSLLWQTKKFLKDWSTGTLVKTSRKETPKNVATIEESVFSRSLRSSSRR